jgi:hypothetical protein
MRLCLKSHDSPSALHLRPAGQREYELIPLATNRPRGSPVPGAHGIELGRAHHQCLQPSLCMDSLITRCPCDDTVVFISLFRLRQGPGRQRMRMDGETNFSKRI